MVNLGITNSLVRSANSLTNSVRHSASVRCTKCDIQIQEK